MKEFFITVLFFLFTIFVLPVLAIKAFDIPSNQTKEYPTCGTIIDVNYDTDVATFEDFNGFQWGFKGVEDWMVGDIIAVIMNDQGTETIFDDQIVDVKYCGYEDE